MAAVTQGERLREELGVLNSERRQFIARASETLAPDEKPDTGEFDRTIEQLQDELTRLAARIKQREDKRTQAAMLVGALRGFLEQASRRSQPLTSVQHPPPQLRDGETLTAALARVRDEIGRLQSDLRSLAAAPLTKSELKAAARRWVEQMAEAGRPQVLIERGQFTVRFMPGAIGDGPLGPGSAAVLSALLPDVVLAALEQQIDAAAGNGVSAADRGQRESMLLARIATLEFDEEALVEQAHENGHDVARRPQCSPLAILAIKTASAQRLAAAS